MDAIEDKRKTRKRDEAGHFKEFVPTDEQRALVKGFAAVGLPQAQIATYLDIDKVTLLKYFRSELDKGMIEANTQIGKILYQKALGGNIAAAIFWAKARMGWSEKIVHANDPDNPMTLSDDYLRAELAALRAKHDPDKE